MELKSYFVILWRRKIVIAIAAAVATIVTLIGTMMMTPKYETSTTLRIATANRGSIDWVDYDVEYTERLMNTYSKIAVSDPVVAQLRQQLDLDEPPNIEVDILANTELMKITIENPDPVVAAQIANLLAQILIDQSKGLDTGDNKTTLEVLNEQLLQLEQELEQGRQEYDQLLSELPEDSERVTAARRALDFRENRYTTLLEQYEQARTRAAVQVNTLTVIEPAIPPLKPSKPRWEINIALGVIIGLAGGLGLAFLFENLDTTLYSIDQIETLTNSPILGQIPTSAALPKIALNNVSAHTEAIRRLRTNILLRDNAGPLQAIALTSAEPGEGKSTIIANLAWAMAQTGRKVALIDGGMRLPT
ncbi:MAG: GNVR domain-containing protein [Anaerolineae bacterium]|nr:GNVR domain-containing protein [Anaerolineae bacterium]